MIVNAAIFTCSICGEVSTQICAYCTKDACSNHRCERCKRCSDCCECEIPLSAEEPVEQVAPAESVDIASPEEQPVENSTIPVEISTPETGFLQPAVPPVIPGMPVVLTPAESSVFVQGTVPIQPPPSSPEAEDSETEDKSGAED